MPMAVKLESFPAVFLKIVPSSLKTLTVLLLRVKRESIFSRMVFLIYDGKDSFDI